MLFLLTGPDRTEAALSDFAPTYINFSSDLEVQGLYEEDRSSSGSASTESSGLAIQELLSLAGLGYIYSPLFIQLFSSASVGLEQEERTNNDRTSRTNSEIYQFRQVIKILPYHPYNLELFAERQVGLLGGRGGGGASITNTSYGARARYDQNPVSSSLSYNRHETESDTKSVTESINGNLNYIDNLTGINGGINFGYNESMRETSDNRAYIYGISLAKAFERVGLQTSWSRNDQKQRTSLVPADQGVPEVTVSDLKNEDWQSSIDVRLPYNFRSRLTYRQGSRENIQENNEGEGNRNFNDSESYTLLLRHRLYKSLNSSFTARQSTSESTGGTSQQKSFQLNESYTKKLPWGSLSSSLSGGYAELENAGAPITLMESHHLDPGNSFELNSELVDRQTIEVSVIDHNNNHQLIPLTEGIHYSVEKRGDTFRIIITPPLPEERLSEPLELEDSYTYQVDYSVIPADYVLGINNYGAGLQLSLFNQLINPRYRYNETKQKVMDGNYPGTPGSSTNHALGIGFNKPPYSADLSRIWLRSTTNDEDRFTAVADYSRELTDFTRTSLSLKYENAQTREDEAGQERELNENIYSASAQLQSYWPSYRLNSSFDINYSLYKGSGETRRYGLNYNLTWHVGRLDLDLSASYSKSESEFAGRPSENEHTRVSFMIRREFF